MIFRRIQATVFTVCRTVVIKLDSRYNISNLSRIESHSYKLVARYKNTLQYKLNRIEKLTGYNPRVFSGALRLFLVILL